MTQGLTFRTKVHFRVGRKGRKHLETADAPAPPADPGHMPRVARMMALAIRFDGLVRQGGLRVHLEGHRRDEDLNQLRAGFNTPVVAPADKTLSQRRLRQGFPWFAGSEQSDATRLR